MACLRHVTGPIQDHLIHDICLINPLIYSKTCLKLSLKYDAKIGFQYRLSLNAGQKYCRMLQGEHSAILLTFIRLSFSFKTFIVAILSGSLRQVLLYCTFTAKCVCVMITLVNVYVDLVVFTRIAGSLKTGSGRYWF